MTAAVSQRLQVRTDAERKVNMAREAAGCMFVNILLPCARERVRYKAFERSENLLQLLAAGAR